jgi:hypothetical protein
MKIKRILVLALFTATALGAQTEDDQYVLDFIDQRFVGYYISLDFVNALERTKHYSTARSFARGCEYIIIFEDRIRYQYPAEDCYYEATEEEARNYQFEYINKRDVFITDEEGIRYKRITSHTEYESTERALSHYIASVVLEDFLKGGEIILEENILIIPALNNRKFDVASWPMWLEEKASLYLYGDDQWVYLEIKGRECTIYRNIRRNRSETTREVIWRTQI